MGNFSEGFWNIFIVVCTLGGIVWLYLLTSQNMGTRRPAGSGEVETTKHVWDEDLTELNNPLPRWWVMLFYITLAFGVLYLMFYPGLGSNSMFLGWNQIKEYEEEMARAEERYGPIFEQYASLPIEEVAADPKALRIGERLFASYCTVCHGADAGGVPGFPNLRDDSWQWGGEPEQIRTSILAGRTGVMPGWRDALGGDAGVDETLAYVFSLSGREVDSSEGRGRQGEVRRGLRRLPRRRRSRQSRPRGPEPRRRRVALRRIGGGRAPQHRGGARRTDARPRGLPRRGPRARARGLGVEPLEPLSARCDASVIGQDRWIPACSGKGRDCLGR